jgi:hypothetical protein
LREHAYQKSRFYHDFHQGLSSAPLSALPVLTKQTLMESFDAVVTRPGLRLVDVEAYLAALRGNELFQNKYFASATAGTTGRRGVFLWNFREWVQVVASYNRAFDWAGSTAGLAHRVKTAVATNRPASEPRFTVAGVPTLRIDSGDDLGTIVTQLNAGQPKMLIAYAVKAGGRYPRRLGGPRNRPAAGARQ